MSKILEEMLGSDGEVSIEKLLLKIEEIDRRLSDIEDKRNYGGVYIDGSPNYVKEHWKKVQEDKQKKTN